MGLQKQQELLERLTYLVGCEFMSDLRLIKSFARIQKAAACIPANAYTVKEWTDAIDYITDKSLLFGTAEQARAFLIGEKEQS